MFDGVCRFSMVLMVLVASQWFSLVLVGSQWFSYVLSVLIGSQWFSVVLVGSSVLHVGSHRFSVFS